MTTGGKILSLNTKIESNTSVSLYWTEENVDNVDIKYSINNLDYITDVSGYTLGSGYTITSLKPNTLYYFSVTPYDADGNTGSAQTVFTGMPYTTQITNFYSVSESKNSVYLQWTGDYHKTSVSYYRPYESYNTITVEYNGKSTAYITDLETDVSYIFEITPYDKYDISGDTTSITVYTDYDSYITDLSISNVTQRTVDLSWNGLFTQTGIQKSIVEDANYQTICNIFDETNSYTVEDGSTRSTTGSITLRYLTPDTTFYFRLRSLNKNSHINMTSSSVTGTTLPGVYDLSTSIVKNDQIILIWEGKYESTESVTLYYKASGEVSYTEQIIDYDSVNDLSFTLNGLTSDQMYFFYMEPTGTDLSSEILTITTDFQGVVNFDISFISTSTIGIELNTDGLGNGPYYKTATVDISHNSVNSGEYWNVNTITEELTVDGSINYTITDLSANEYYSIKVTPYSTYGVEYDPHIILNTCTAAEITYFTMALDSSLEYFVLSWNGSLSDSKYEYSTDSNFTTSTIVSVSNDNVTISGDLYIYTTPDLSATTTYYIRMIPINRDDVEGNNTYYLYNPDVSSIYITDVTTSTFKLNWGGVFDNIGIFYSTDGGETFEELTTTSVDTSAILTTNSSYIYRVQPSNSNVNGTEIDISGAYSNSVYVPYISSLFIDNIATDGDTIDLSWVGGHTIQSYSVAWSDAVDGTYTIITDSMKTGDLLYTVGSDDIDDFDLSNSYYFRIIPYVEGTNAPVWTTGLSSEYVYNASISSISVESVTTNSVTLNFDGTYETADVSYSGPTTGIKTGITSTGSYTITDLSSNSNYTFTVLPYNNSSIYGKRSSSVSSVLTSLIEGFDINYDSTQTSSSTVVLTWTNSTVYTSVQIDSSENDTTQTIWSGDDEIYTDTGLLPNRLYFYTARVYDSAGNVETITDISGYTNASATDLDLTATVSRGNIVGDAETVDLSWANTGYYNTLTIYDSVGGVTEELEPSTTTTYHFSDLSANTTYTYDVSLTNLVKNTNQDATTNVTVTTLGTIDTTITHFHSETEVTDASFQIRVNGWFSGVIVDISNDVESGNTVVFSSLDGNGSNTDFELTLNSTNSIVSEANKEYTVRVAAINSVDDVNDYTSTDVIRTLGKMTEFYWEDKGATADTIDLYWDGSFGNVLLEQATDSGFTTGLVSTAYEDLSQSHTVEGLDANTWYHYRITPRNTPHVNLGMQSGITMDLTDISAATLGKIVYADISGLGYINSNTVGIEWDGSFTSVNIWASISGEDNYILSSLTINDTFVLFNDLSANTEYNFKIIPVNINNTLGDEFVIERSVKTLGDITIYDVCHNTLGSHSLSIECYGNFTDLQIDVDVSTTFTEDMNSFYYSYLNTNQYDIDDLDANKLYYFRVATGGTPFIIGDNSNIIIYNDISNSYIDISAVTLGNITQFEIVDANVKSFEIPFIWDGSFEYVKISTYQGEQVQYAVDETSGSITGLQPNEDFSFTIIPVNKAGVDGIATETIVGRTLAYIDGVYSLSADITTYTFTSHITDDSSYTSFYIEYTNVDTTQTLSSELILDPSRDGLVIDLSSNSNYDITVYAYNDVLGQSLDVSYSYSLKTRPYLEALSQYDSSSLYVELLLYGNYSSFYVDYDLPSGDTITSNIFDASLDNYTHGKLGSLGIIENLEPDTRYPCVIYAFNLVSGEGLDVSGEFFFRTIGTIPAFTLLSYTIDSIVFEIGEGTYTTARFTVGTGSDVSGTKIFQQDMSLNDISDNNYIWELTGTGDLNTTDSSGILPNTIYYITMTTINADGLASNPSANEEVFTQGNLVSYDVSYDTITAYTLDINVTGNYSSVIFETAKIDEPDVYTSFEGSYSTETTTITDLTANTQYNIRITPLVVTPSVPPWWGNEFSCVDYSNVLIDASVVTLGAIYEELDTSINDTSVTIDNIKGRFSKMLITSENEYNNTDTSGEITADVAFDETIDTEITFTDMYSNTTYDFSFVVYNSLDVANDIIDEGTKTLQLTTKPKLESLTLDTVTKSDELDISWVNYSNVYHSHDYILLQRSITIDGTYIDVSSIYYDETNTSYTLTDLSVNTRYYIKATPYSSDDVSGTTLSLVDIEVHTLGIGTITDFIIDTPNEIDISYSFDASYVILNVTDGANYDVSSSITIETETFVDLSSNTQYTITLYPYNDNGITGSSVYDFSSCYTLATASFVSALTTEKQIDISTVDTGFDASYVTISLFDNVSEIQQGDTVRVYEGGVSANFTDLSVNTQYRIEMYPYNDINNTNSSVFVTETMYTLGEISSNDIIITIDTSGEIDVEITESGFTDASYIDIYIISEGLSFTGINTAGTSTFTDLSHNTEYTIEVRPYNNDGVTYSSVYQTESIYTLAYLTDVSVVTYDSTSITLSWI